MSTKSLTPISAWAYGDTAVIDNVNGRSIVSLSKGKTKWN